MATLQTIPSELREKIYRLLLVLPAEEGKVLNLQGPRLTASSGTSSSGSSAAAAMIPPVRRRTFWLGPNQRVALHPAILRVCRDIYQEAVRVLYTQNRFQLPNAGGRVMDGNWLRDMTPAVRPFLGQIGGVSTMMLTHVTIRVEWLHSWYTAGLAYSDLVCASWGGGYASAEAQRQVRDSQAWQADSIPPGYRGAIGLLGRACPGLKTLEIKTRPPNFRLAHDDLDWVGEVLHLLHHQGGIGESAVGRATLAHTSDYHPRPIRIVLVVCVYVEHLNQARGVRDEFVRYLGIGGPVIEGGVRGGMGRVPCIRATIDSGARLAMDLQITSNI